MTRLVDRPFVERERIVDAAPRDVWPLCCDLPSFEKWSPEHLGGHWLPPATRPELGARYRGDNRSVTGAVTTTVSTITVFSPPTEITWVVDGIERPTATWSFLLAPVEGGARLRQRVVLGLGASPLTEAITSFPDKEDRIIARRCEVFASNIDAVLDGIAQSVEPTSRPAN